LLYVFVEYVRPQSVYPLIDVLPWGKVFLFLALGFTVIEGRLSFSSKSLWACVVAYSVVLVASGILSEYPDWAWEGRTHWLNWLILMLIVGAGIRTRKEFLLLLLSFCLWNLKMSQHGVQGWVGSGFSFVDWGATGAPGWFHNSGEFGIEMCVFAPLVGYLTFGLWPELSRTKRILAVLVVLSALASVIASSSRGAFFGMAVVGAWIALRSPHRLKAMIVSIVLIGGTWILLPEENKARWREAGDDKNSKSRLTYWEHGIEIAKDHPILGIGYNNWLPYYHAHYNPRGELPHNYLVQAGAELGFTGLGVFLVMTGVYFRVTARVRRRTSVRAERPDRLLWAITFGLDGAMIGFLASGFFVTVLYYPYYWMNLAMAMALARVEADRPVNTGERSSQFAMVSRRSKRATQTGGRQ
jgi:O-antigen ligase